MQRGHSYRQRLFCYLQQRMIQGKPTPPQTTFPNIPGDFKRDAPCQTSEVFARLN